MRFHRHLSTAALVLAAGMALTGCSSSPQPEDEQAQPTAAATSQAAALQQAARNTESEQTARISIEGSMSGQGSTIRTSGEGVIDFATGDAEMALTADALGADQSMTLVSAGGTTYMQMPMMGDVWVRSPSSLGELAGTAPEQALSSLEEVSNLAEVGQEDIDGQTATHYTGSLDLGELLAQAAALDKEQKRQAKKVLQSAEGQAMIDVWVDDDDRVVQIRQSVELDLGEGGSNEQSTQIRFTDFGVEVDVAAPEADKVIDAGELGDVLGGGIPGAPVLPDSGSGG